MIIGNLFGQPAPVPAGTNADGAGIEIELNIEGGGGGAPDLEIDVDERSTGSAHSTSSNEGEQEQEGTVPYHTNGRWTRFGKAVAALTMGGCVIATGGLAAWERANPTIKATKSVAIISSKAPKEASAKTPKGPSAKAPKGQVSVAPSFFPSAMPIFFPSAMPSGSAMPTECDCVGFNACSGNTGEFFSANILCLIQMACSKNKSF